MVQIVSEIPDTHRRRSFLYRHLREEGAVFGIHNGMAVPLLFGSSLDEEITQAIDLGLADLTCLPRIGFKGKGAIEWASEMGLKIGEASNRAYPQKDDSLVLRLAPTEVLVLGGLGDRGNGVQRLTDAWRWQEGAPRKAMGYPVPRQDSHFCFALTGKNNADMMAKICGVDLRSGHFDNHEIAQTSVAKMSAIIVRADIGWVPVFFLLGDMASSLYFFSAIEDAMKEYRGRLIGLRALLAHHDGTVPNEHHG